MTPRRSRPAMPLGQVLAHLTLTGASVVVLIPFVYLLSVSLRRFRDVISGTWLFTPTLASYKKLFESGAAFPSLLLNSIIISVVATLASVFVGSLGAYALGRFSWPRWFARGLLYWLVVVQTIPAIALVGPFYSIGLQTGLYNTKFILILAYMGINLPLVVWLLLAYFQSIPRELEEAAVMDGATWSQVFFRIAVPLAAPAIAAAGILAFIFSWKEFLLALSLTSTPQAMTLPVGIAGFVQNYNIEYGQMSAAAIIAVVPGLLLAAFAQRYIVTGLTAGSVKS